MPNETEIRDFLPLSRKFFRHDFWEEERVFSRAEAWLDLIRRASFNEENGQLINGIHVSWNRGQVVASLRFLGCKWGWSTKKVSNFLDFLGKQGMAQVGKKKETGVGNEKETGITFITICKYDTYNPVQEKRKQERNSLGNRKETAEQQRGNDINIENNTTYTPEQKSKYEQFNQWLEKYAPTVLKMKEPITIEQYHKLQAKYHDQKDLLLKKLQAMDNKVTLLKEYKSAYKTLDNWMSHGPLNGTKLKAVLPELPLAAPLKRVGDGV
jgi:hypothetical protein